MPRNFKLTVILAIAAFVVFWINYRIYHHDLSFYVGKDNGFTIRFVSVCFLSAIFYCFIAENNRFILFFVGIFSGVLSNILSYMIWFFFLDDYGLSFHIIACCLFVLIFILIDHFFPSFTKKNVSK
jgi:hypothetical protein